MKLLAIWVWFVFLFGQNLVFAQTVERVTGADAVISLRGAESVTAGDEVHFLSGDLEVKGRGQVKKVSEGGKKALVKITSGQPRVGMSVEVLPAKDVSQKQVEEPKKSSGNGELIGVIASSEEDREVNRIGYISDARYVIGGILGVYPGFGIGHAVQGRYSQRGWIFTVGEVGSLMAFVLGAVNCWGTTNSSGSCDGTGITIGALGYFGFKIWEIVDIWAAPIEINQRYRELHLEPSSEVSGIVMPTKDGVVAGLQYRF